MKRQREPLNMEWDFDRVIRLAREKASEGATVYIGYDPEEKHWFYDLAESYQPQDLYLQVNSDSDVLPINPIDLGICGVVCNAGPNREPVACAYPMNHEGYHSWSTMPTFPADKKSNDALRIALLPVAQEFANKGLTAKGAAHYTYNPEAHGPEITLTIAEIRAIWAALGD